MAPNYDIDQFVKDNAPYLTMSDMVDETRLTRYELQKACDRLNITPISKADQTKAAIKQWANKKTIEEFIKMSGLGKAIIMEHCKELGIKFLPSPKTKQPQVKSKSPTTVSSPLRSTIGNRLAAVNKYLRPF